MTNKDDSHSRQSGSTGRYNTSSRRNWIRTIGAGTALGLAGCVSGSSGPDTVQVAEILPLSGPWADLGQRSIKGGEFAAKEINENGGIEALDGAEISIVEADVEGSVDTATTAAQDVIANNNLSAAMGAWLSSFTIGVSGITERQGIPLLSQSYSDKLIEQEYNYLFKFSPLSSQFAQQAVDILPGLASNAGVDLQRVGIARDNSAASEAFGKAMERLAPKAGLSIEMNQVWTPPLSDATSVVRKMQESDLQLVFWGATATEDAISIRQKMNELDVSLPLFGNGTWSVTPSFLEAVGPELVSNLMANESSHMMPATEDVVRRFAEEYPSEPFMNEDAMNHYGQIHTLKAAIENAGSADPTDIKNEMHSMKLTEGAGVNAFPVDSISFTENGLMENASVVIPQWQKSGDADFVASDWAPFTVHPEKYAHKQVQWPTAGE